MTPSPSKLSGLLLPSFPFVSDSGCFSFWFVFLLRRYLSLSLRGKIAAGR